LGVVLGIFFLNQWKLSNQGGVPCSSYASGMLFLKCLPLGVYFALPTPSRDFAHDGFTDNSAHIATAVAALQY
jgi:hypothetical protein